MYFRPGPDRRELTENIHPLKPMKSESLFSALQTDQAVYRPNHRVRFSLESKTADAHLNISYYHLGEKIGYQTLHINNKGNVQWVWNPPKKDYQGYLAVMTLNTHKKRQTQTIGIDVSSDWSRFPRYGFMSDYHKQSNQQIRETISKLNRYHLNGLQFYDWSDKHHRPLTVNNGQIPSSWTDIANREVDGQTLRSLIDTAHSYHMKAMSYNLLYGALADSEKDGTRRNWFLFKDSNHGNVDVNPLPNGWKSNIYLMNPANPGWQNYLIGQQKLVYRYLPFDGWHVDQLGDRGTVYDEKGDVLPLQDNLASFLNKIKEKTPGKDLVMNAVGQFGQKNIASSDVNFLYTEVWDQTPSYSDLKRIIDENNAFSAGKKNTVLAAYMDYKKSESPGQFNEPGILLADSVIFAYGGDHIELGEHMLSKEYFPYSQLSMSPSLSDKIVHYYDFLTAYENLLRDGAAEARPSIRSDEQLPLSTEPQQNHIWTFAKIKGNQKAIHLVNFLDAHSMNWRDTDGTLSSPIERKHLNFTIAENRPVKKIWMASPDIQDGKPISISFKQKDGSVHLSIPSLLYWDMLVLEF
jgi:dextranase